MIPEVRNTKSLLIDATNIHSGGGLLHLIKILEFAPELEFPFSQVIVCAPEKTLSYLPKLPWLSTCSHPLLNRGYASWWKWRMREFRKVLAAYGDPALFVAGTIKPPFNYAYTTICQNLLPLQLGELFRYRLSFDTFRLLILRYLHLSAYKHASGVIFLTKFSFLQMPERIQKSISRWEVIPHGVDHRAFAPSGLERQRQNKNLSLLYVSVFGPYKHQDKIARAVLELNRDGYSISLTLAGGHVDKPMLRRVMKLKSEFAMWSERVHLVEEVPFEKISTLHSDHDVMIFGSTCETFGMVITEAMASAMPLLCSNRSSMQETAGDAAIYFNPLDNEDVKLNILKIYGNKVLQENMSEKSYERAKAFCWQKCSRATFSFLGS